jgi:hypothetical protein
MWALLATLVAILLALGKWPVAQMYAIAAFGVAFMAFTAWGFLEPKSPRGQRRRVHFSLRTLTLWIVPYVAAVACVLRWDGPWNKEFLNANARSAVIIVMSQAWVYAFIAVRMRSLRSQAAAAARQADAR